MKGEMKMAKTVLELKDAWKIYKMDSIEVPVMRGMSMKINEGEFVGILGASGSGKSTTLNIMGCLDVPTRGAVILDGVDVTNLSEEKLARIRGKKIGFVFQTFNLYPTLNVYENIALPMRIHEFTENEIHTNVNELIKQVGLGHRHNYYPSQLSGGERQRVAIARALSTEPAIILADEPTGNLDTKTSTEIMGILTGLHEEQNKTIAVVTHEHDIAAYTERTITLKDGQIISEENLKRRS
jgi:putative ABC transport system ATP-binding protein